jgi:glycosyltransferase-like protein
MAAAEALDIALFTYSTQPRGGVAHALALGEALQRAGQNVCVYAVDRPGSRFSREPACDWKVVEVDRHVEGLYDLVRRRSDALVAAMRDEPRRFDVYHAHDSISSDALRRLCADGTIPAYVRTVHHLTTEADPRLAEVARASIEKAGRVFVVSEKWRSALRKEFGIAAPIVGNGVDRSRFFAPVASGTPVRDTTRPHFVTIGGVEERKNTIALLDAFAIVKGLIPGARLTIAGGASVLDHNAYRRAFDASAAELGMRAGIDFEITRSVSDAEILALLHAADAFVFPSLVEGFGLVVLEAMACGVPVVVSNVAPFSDYLTADDALLVEPSSSLSIATGMLSSLDPRIGARLRARGPVIASRYSWDDVARACLRGYVA